MNDTIPSRLFDYDKSTNEFSAESSELRGYGYWRDFYIKSSKTGVKVKFRISSVTKDNDGDIMYWNFVSTDLRYKCIIFND